MFRRQLKKTALAETKPVALSRLLSDTEITSTTQSIGNSDEVS